MSNTDFREQLYRSLTGLPYEKNSSPDDIYKTIKTIVDIASKLHEGEVERIIGENLDDSNGWDWAFSKEAQCCPGDDFADFGNHIKAEQRQRAAIKPKGVVRNEPLLTEEDKS